MRKPAIAIAILLALMPVTSATVAFADPHNPASNHRDLDDDDRQKPDPGEQHETDRMHRDLDERYGEIDQVSIPPIGFIPEAELDADMFILPEINQVEPTQVNPLPSKAADPTYLVVPVGQESALKTSASPSKFAPINLKDLVFTKTTPADEFVRTSVLILAALAVLAAILLALVSKNVLSLKRNSKVR